MKPTKSGFIATSHRPSFCNSTALRTLDGPQLVDLRDQVPEGVAGVEDVVDQQHVAAAHAEREQIRVDTSGPRQIALAAIASGLHQFDPQRAVQQPDQVGQQHDAADQHADDRQRLALIVFLNLAGQAANALAELFFGEQGFHVWFFRV